MRRMETVAKTYFCEVILLAKQGTTKLLINPWMVLTQALMTRDKYQSVVRDPGRDLAT